MGSTAVSALEGLKQNDYLTGMSTSICDLLILWWNIVALLTVFAYDYGGQYITSLFRDIGLIPYLQSSRFQERYFSSILR